MKAENAPRVENYALIATRCAGVDAVKCLAHMELSKTVGVIVAGVPDGAVGESIACSHDDQTSAGTG